MKRFTRWVGLLGLAGSLGLIAILATGCQEDGTDSAGAALIGASDDAATAELFAPPSIDELKSRLNLTDDQSRQLAAILDEAKSMRAERRAARGQGPADMAPKAGGMLADAAAILETGQLQEFSAMMKERRQAQREEMKQRRDEKGGPGHGPNRAARFPGLSDTDQKALREVHRSAGEQMRTLHEQYAAGSISAEQLRDGLRDIRTTTEPRVRAILGDEAFEKMQSRRGDRREAMAEKRLDRIDDTPERQAAMLGKALRLTDGQASQVKAALEKTIPAREALLKQVESGGLAPEEVLYQGIQIHRQASAEIRALLNVDQAARFDAIEDLLPGKMGHGMPGMGPGFSPGGPRGFGAHRGPGRDGR